MKGGLMVQRQHSTASAWSEYSSDQQHDAMGLLPSPDISTSAGWGVSSPPKRPCDPQGHHPLMQEEGATADLELQQLRGALRPTNLKWNEGMGDNAPLDTPITPVVGIMSPEDSRRIDEGTKTPFR